jgi:hypothetical protein
MGGAHREMAVGLVIAALLTALLVDYSLGFVCRTRDTFPCRPSDSPPAPTAASTAPAAGSPPGVGGGAGQWAATLTPLSGMTPWPAPSTTGAAVQPGQATAAPGMGVPSTAAPPPAFASPTEAALEIGDAFPPFETTAGPPQGSPGSQATVPAFATIEPSPPTGYPPSAESRRTAAAGYP